MDRHQLTDRFVRYCVVGGFAFGLAAAAPAGERLADSATITVFADRYVSQERAFDDLDALEKHITMTEVRSVVVLLCGPQATRALKAVVHRFRHLPMQIRVPDLDERDCFSMAPLATAVRMRAGTRPFGIDDEAVDRYWHDLMP